MSTKPSQAQSITPNGGSAISMAYRGPGQAQRLTAGGTSYQYDATGLSQSSSGSPAYYTTTPDGVVLSERLSTGTYYYLHDGLGSVVGLTNSTGSVVNSYAYDPYGNSTSATGTTANPFRYIGAVWDSQTGLYKMGERYYDPSIGRFTQQDPLGGGYGYAGGNPVNAVDATGLSNHRPRTTHQGHPKQLERYHKLYRGPKGPQEAFKHIERYHGVSRQVLSGRLEAIKHAASSRLSAAARVVISATGDVFDEATGDFLGSLTEGGGGGFEGGSGGEGGWIRPELLH